MNIEFNHLSIAWQIIARSLVDIVNMNINKINKIIIK